MAITTGSWWVTSKTASKCVLSREKNQFLSPMTTFAVSYPFSINRGPNMVWLKPRKLERELRKQGLKGNPYRLLFGDIKDNFRMRSEQTQKPIPFTNDYFGRVLPLLHQHMLKYGKNCFTWMGPVPSICITEPELIRDALTKMSEFSKPPLNPLLTLLAPGLASYEGQKWAKHRKLLNPAFHMEKLKLMVPAFSASISETINTWEKMVSGSATGSSEIDVWPYLTTLSADVISRSAFGSSYEQGSRIFQLIQEQTDLIMRLFLTSYIPGWKYLPTKDNKRMKEVSNEIQRLLIGVIEKRKKAIEDGEPTKDDLLGILMDSNFQETQSGGSNKQHLGMSFQEIIDECKVFYFAGQETTSVLLAWTMILLGSHQDWQTRAREEVLDKFGMNQPDFDGLNHLKTVTMILYEVLRLYPPATAVSRAVNNDGTKLGDLHIPAGARVTLAILHCHQDPKIWGDDALEFNPGRFSEGIAKATKGNMSFFPFGWGPRICIGQHFALTEAKMALAMILQHFWFELSPSYAHAPTSVITLRPQYGAHITLYQIK